VPLAAPGTPVASVVPPVVLPAMPVDPVVTLNSPVTPPFSIQRRDSSSKGLGGRALVRADGSALTASISRSSDIRSRFSSSSGFGFSDGGDGAHPGLPPTPQPSQLPFSPQPALPVGPGSGSDGGTAHGGSSSSATFLGERARAWHLPLFLGLFRDADELVVARPATIVVPPG
jgi:hypothetical protein